MKLFICVQEWFQTNPLKRFTKRKVKLLAKQQLVPAPGPPHHDCTSCIAGLYSRNRMHPGRSSTLQCRTCPTGLTGPKGRGRVGCRLQTWGPFPALSRMLSPSVCLSLYLCVCVCGYINKPFSLKKIPRSQGNTSNIFNKQN